MISRWPWCDRWPCGFSPDTWSNWVLAALGVTGAIFAYRTVKATVTAANAARVSAEALMDGERAWVLIEPPNWNRETVRAGFPPFTDITIKNSGKTAARIHKISACYLLTTKSELAEYPDYSLVKPYNDLLLVPEDSIQHGVSRDDADNLSNGRDPLAFLRSKRAFLYLYALVEYKDIYNRSHETQVGYIFNVPESPYPAFTDYRFVRIDSPLYNRAT